jgi:hypothetical protein
MCLVVGWTTRLPLSRYSNVGAARRWVVGNEEAGYDSELEKELTLGMEEPITSKSGVTQIRSSEYPFHSAPSWLTSPSQASFMKMAGLRTEILTCLPALLLCSKKCHVALITGPLRYLFVADSV